MRWLDVSPRLAIAAAAAFVAAAAPVGVAGPWRLSEVGGKVGCTLSLTEAPAIGGYEVKAPAACRLAFPPIKGVSTWSVDGAGSLVLSDPERRRIVLLQARSASLWEGPGPDGGDWRLERAPAARADSPLAAGGASGR